MPPLADLAALNPDLHTRAFWEFCARRELRFQRCGGCGCFRQPPRPGCPFCGEAAAEWVRVAGRGRVFSYTIVHHAAVPQLRDAVPYNVVTVEFDDGIGTFLGNGGQPVAVILQVEFPRHIPNGENGDGSFVQSGGDRRPFEMKRLARSVEKQRMIVSMRAVAFNEALE